jgi:hypothetical protein
MGQELMELETLDKAGRPRGRVIRRFVAALVFGAFAALSVSSVEGCKPKQKGALGADCNDASDCDSALCSEATGVCSKACTYDKDCGGSLVCHAMSDTHNECNKSQGQAVGGSCMNGGDCANGICLHYVGKEAQPGICSKYCQTTDECPNNYKICDKITDLGLLKVCIPGDPKTASSADKSKFGKPNHGGKKKKKNKKDKQ